jgi:hypothetical protein
MVHCLNRIAIAATISCVVGCGSGDVAKNPSQDPSASAAQAERQLFGPFSFEVPPGWLSVTPDRDKTKAMLLLDGTNWQRSPKRVLQATENRDSCSRQSTILWSPDIRRKS